MPEKVEKRPKRVKTDQKYRGNMGGWRGFSGFEGLRGGWREVAGRGGWEGGRRCREGQMFALLGLLFTEQS